MIATFYFNALNGLSKAERELELVLDSLYGAHGGWRDYETYRRERSLDIYGVIPSDAAVDALHRAGFASVTQHDHDIGEFVRCACR